MRRVGQAARELSIKTSARTLRWVFGALLGAGLLTFQNCTQPADMGNVDQNSLMAMEMPFHYDTTLDQIAYMSCPNVVTKEKQNVDSDLYFTFRAGAYRFGGIKLSDSFFQTYQRKLPERMASLLSNSPANTSTVLQLAVRQTGNLNSLVSAPGNVVQNIDFANLFAVLGSTEMSTNLVSAGLDTNFDPPVVTGKRLKYLRDGTGRGAHLAGSLNFGESESMQSSLRHQYLGSGAAILALTYLEPASSGASSSGPSVDTDVRSPSTVGVLPSPSATPLPSTPGLGYGTGYQITFGQPKAGARGLQEQNPPGTFTGREIAPYPSNVMTTITEKNLVTGSHVGAQWNCPDSLRFMIVRPGDENDIPGGPCQHMPDPPQPWDPEYAILRNALHSEDWYIDTVRKCVIPKRSLGYTCYGDMYKINYVQYDLTDNSSASRGCDSNSNEQTNGPVSKICAAWVSVCYRLNP